MRRPRTGALLASLPLALTAGILSPSLAAADPVDQPAAALTTSARDLGNCQVEFSITNTTNVTSYTLDWRIDDEPLRTNPDIPFPYGRTGGMSATVDPGYDGPIFPRDAETRPNTEQDRWMRSGLTPSTATYTKDLKNITDSYNPALPNPDNDVHVVRYRLALGPAGNNAEPQWGDREWLGDRDWKTVVVTGCAPEPDPNEDDDTPWSGLFEMLFGSLGS